MKTTVQVEGKAVEVDIPGVISEADVAARYMPKDVFEAELSRRGTSIAESKGFINPKTLDEAGKRKLLDTLGLEVVTDGDSGAIGKQVETARKQWTETELAPVLTREAAGKSEIETLRRDRLTADIVASAAKAGVLPSVLAGENPAILALVQQKSRFGFDEKSRRWYVQGPNGPVFAASPTEQQPYKGVDEAVLEWVRDPVNKPFVGVTTQQGPGLQGGGAGGSAVVVLTSEQAGNKTMYDAALAKVGNDPARIRVADAQGQ